MKRWSCKNSKKDFYLLYTLAFAAISLFLYSFFYMNGKSLIWSHDGVPQHVNSLAYYGKYLRDIFHTLVTEHKLSIPMWDMHIGYGSDILTTLHYYVIGDPLTLLSVFVPENNAETLYEILFFLRIYLAGITFSLFCFSHGNGKQAVFLGTLIYIFAGWTIYAAVKHPYFANPMIYLPLILMGIDKIYKKEKPTLFISSVTIAAMSNFYFFYMICIFMFLYAAFRYFDMFENHSVINIGKWFLKFLGYFTVALMISSIILLPVIMALFGTERFQAANYVPMFYDRIYYEKYLGCLIGENMIQWGVAGYSAVAMAGVFVLFSKRKKYVSLKNGFLLLNLFLLVPFAGHVLNGFSYVSNRWIWAYGMLISYIFVKAYPELFTLTVKEKRKVFLLILIYCCLALFAEAARTQRNMAAIIFLILSGFILISYGTIFTNGKYLCILLSGVLIMSISVNIYYQYSYEKDYLSEFSDRGEALEKLESGADLAVLNTEDSSVYRYDQYASLPYDNSSMKMGTNSTAYYFSVANGAVSRFFDEMYLNTPWEQHYENLDSRTILDRLCAVRYFVIPGNGYGYLPYGYTSEAASASKNNRQYHAYINEGALPIGYTYSSYIPREQYEKMSVNEKQEALLQGIVLDHSVLPEITPEFMSELLEYDILEGDGCHFEDGKIVVTNENAQMKISFDGLDNSETYLVLEGLNYDALSPRERVSKKTWENMSIYKQNALLFEDSQWRYWKESKEASIRVNGLQCEKTMKVFTDKYNAYSGKHDFLCNLGYWDDCRRSVTLTFENTGIYSFDKLQIICQPMDHIEEWTDALGEEVLEDVQIDVNEISGKITLSDARALLLAIPYSSGFRAYVDGEETELHQANTMFMALELPDGNHEIRLTYCTPYAKAGVVLSALGLIGFAGIVCTQRKKRKKK